MATKFIPYSNTFTDYSANTVGTMDIKMQTNTRVNTHVNTHVNTGVVTEIEKTSTYKSVLIEDYKLMILDGTNLDTTQFLRKNPNEKDLMIMITRNCVVEGIYEVDTVYHIFCILSRYTAPSCSQDEHILAITSFINLQALSQVGDLSVFKTIGFRVYVYAKSLACAGFRSTNFNRVSRTCVGVCLPEPLQEYVKELSS